MINANSFPSTEIWIFWFTFQISLKCILRFQLTIEPTLIQIMARRPGFSGNHQRNTLSFHIPAEIRVYPMTRTCLSYTVHYNDVIMSAMASQITSLTIVYSTVYAGADQRKHQSSASLAFVRGIHRWPVNSSQMASNAENVSIWWRHHATPWRLTPINLPIDSRFNTRKVSKCYVVCAVKNHPRIKRRLAMKNMYSIKYLCVFIEDDGFEYWRWWSIAFENKINHIVSWTNIFLLMVR